MLKRIFILSLLLFVFSLSFTNHSSKRSVFYKIINIENFRKNPFLIDFPDKKDITYEDYEEIQEKLQTIDISRLLHRLYSTYPLKGLSFESFVRRCTTGINQKLINREEDQFPIAKLEKIGKGGEWCIVSSAPYDNVRNIFLEGLVKQLHNINFDGYVYYRMGGYPNPTGKEIRYAGVPYAIKIFMMMEAKALGFNKVLWIDSALWPVKNIDIFFHYIDEYGAIFHLYNKSVKSENIFLETRKKLQQLTGKDPCTSPHVWGAIFGLDFSKKKVKSLINEYMSLVEFGTPFPILLPRRSCSHLFTG